MKKSHDTNEQSQTPDIPDSIKELMTAGLEMKLHLVQHHAQMAFLLAQEIMEDESASLTGEKYKRNKPFGGRYSRWGSNPGSIRIDEERIPIQIPRVRDVEASQERPLESYQSLKNGIDIDERLEKSILLGLSTRDYAGVSGSILEGFGLSQSSVSRSFQESSAKALEEFESRRFDEEEFIALWLDGKYLARHQIVICLGLTEGGHKIPLGFVETTTENAEAVKGLLQDLLRRGLSFERGILCVIDGSKGLKKAVSETFGEHAIVQRCQYHKRENVVGYLNEKDKTTYRRRLQRAYQQPTYDQARAALYEVHTDLSKLNRSAANSLVEGLEETLTLHRLGIFEKLGYHLKTTNAIENLNSQLGKYLGRVKRWMHSDQRQRWVAMALLETESRMRRIQHYDQLPFLREALIHNIEGNTEKPAESELSLEKNFN
jgi:transposase-like protein